MAEALAQRVEEPKAQFIPPPVLRQFHALRMGASFRWRITQAVADFLTVVVAATSSYWLYLESGLGKAHFEPTLYFGLHVTLGVLIVFGLHGQGAYRGQVGLLRIEAIRRVLNAVCTGLALVLAFTFFLQLETFSRLSVLVLLPVVTVALVAQRIVLWNLQQRYRRRQGRIVPVVVYGAGETGRVLAQQLLDEHALGLRPAAFLDDDPTRIGEEVRIGAGVRGERVPVLGGEDAIERVVSESGAGAVILAMPSASSDRIAAIIAHLDRLGIPFFCVPGAGSLYLSALRFGQLGGIPVFARRIVEAQRAYEITKRAIDVIGSLSLLVLTAPVVLFGALLVRLTSPGPVFFRQERVGLRGEPFTIFKLRTMRQDSPRYESHPSSPTDARITAVGRWLRRTSIDELPQLWNVVRGEMSLVGPRPEMPFIVSEYTDIHRQRLSVKPGVTGLWQISGDRAFKIHDNLQYDLYYVERRSLGLDVAILLTTPFVLVARDRAM